MLGFSAPFIVLDPVYLCQRGFLILFYYVSQTSLFLNEFVFLFTLAEKVFGMKLFSFFVFIFY